MKKLINLTLLILFIAIPAYGDECSTLHRLIQEEKVYQFEERLEQFSTGKKSKWKKWGAFFKIKDLANYSPIEDPFLNCLTTPDARGDLILHKLAKLGWLNAAEKVWSQSPTLNELNREGLTPITLAIQAGLPHMSRALYEAGADLNRSGRNAPTALQAAVIALEFDLVKRDWINRNSGREPALPSILSHLNRNEAFESIIETEVLFDRNPSRQILQEVVAWYKNLESLGTGDWNPAEKDFPLSEYVQFLHLRIGPPHLNLIQLVDFMGHYSLQRYPRLFKKIATSNLQIRSHEVNHAEDFRELRQLITLLHPNPVDQKEIEEKLRPTLRERYVKLVYEALKGDPTFQKSVLTEPEPAFTNLQKCPICLSPAEEGAPLERSACGNCFLHRDCEIGSWNHFIAHHGVTRLECPFCRTKIGIQAAIDGSLPAEYQYKLRIIAIKQFLENQKGWENCKTPECPGVAVLEKDSDTLNSKPNAEEDSEKGILHKVNLFDVVANEGACYACQQLNETLKIQNLTRRAQMKSAENFIKRQMMLGRLKRCPKCSWIIEKNRGCDHMTCRKCGYEFWWTTLKPFP